MSLPTTITTDHIRHGNVNNTNNNNNDCVDNVKASTRDTFLDDEEEGSFYLDEFGETGQLYAYADDEQVETDAESIASSISSDYDSLTQSTSLFASTVYVIVSTNV